MHSTLGAPNHYILPKVIFEGAARQNLYSVYFCIDFLDLVAIFQKRKPGRPGFEIILAEKKGFEPLQDLHPLSVFETDPFSRLGISPARVIIA